MLKNKSVLILILLIVLAIYIFSRHSAKNTNPLVSHTATITPSQTSPTSKPKANIYFTSPSPESIIQFPLIVTGQARVFENQLSYAVLGSEGKILIQGNTTSEAREVGQFGPFTLTINSLDNYAGEKITIKVFSLSPQDGDEADTALLPLKLKPL